MDLNNLQIPKIKISIRILAFLIAGAGLLITYFVVGKQVPVIQAQTTALVKENEELEATKSRLQNMYEHMSEYLEERDKMYADTKEILGQFPTFMYLEDKILYVDTLLKTDFENYNLTEVTYGQSTYITSVTAGADGSMLELYSVALNGRYNDLSYQQVKDIINYGLSSSQRFIVNSITVGYNETTGYLSGDLSFTTYFIPGQETPYEFPDSVIDAFGDSNRVGNLMGARN
jgi:hypothetical protein